MTHANRSTLPGVLSSSEGFSPLPLEHQNVSASKDTTALSALEATTNAHLDALQPCKYTLRSLSPNQAQELNFMFSHRSNDYLNVCSAESGLESNALNSTLGSLLSDMSYQDSSREFSASASPFEKLPLSSQPSPPAPRYKQSKWTSVISKSSPRIPSDRALKSPVQCESIMRGGKMPVVLHVSFLTCDSENMAKE